MPVSESLYVPVLPVPPERVCVLVPEGAPDVFPLASPRADSKMLKHSWRGKRKAGASGAWKVRLEVALWWRVPLHVTSHVTS